MPSAPATSVSSCDGFSPPFHFSTAMTFSMRTDADGRYEFAEGTRNKIHYNADCSGTPFQTAIYLPAFAEGSSAEAGRSPSCAAACAAEVATAS